LACHITRRCRDHRQFKCATALGRRHGFGR